MATLAPPVVLLVRACVPTAVFPVPVVSERSASLPKNVLLRLRLQPSWQVARACGESPKQRRASGMSSKASRTGDRLIERFNGRSVVFINAEDCINLALLSSMFLKALATAQSIILNDMADLIRAFDLTD